MTTVERFREAVRKAIGDRPVANVAEDAGLPRDAIRYVLLGRDPRLSRVAEIAEALDLHFTIGQTIDPASAQGLRRQVQKELEDTQQRIDAILSQPSNREPLA